MKVITLILTVATTYAAISLPSTMNKRCLECVYEGHTFCDVDAGLDNRVVKSSEFCVAAGAKCPPMHVG